MKIKNVSISLALFLTIGIITIVSFSLGCTDQEENSSKPVEDVSLQTEAVANTSGIINTSEPIDNISQQPQPVRNISSHTGSSAGISPQSGPSGGASSQSQPSEDTSQRLEPVSADKLTSTRWLWAGYRHFDSYNEVPDPENYTLSFLSDGTCYIKSECNSGNGSYTLEEKNLTIDSTAIPLMACGPDSMDPEYMELLANVNSATIEDGQLVLYSSEGDKMVFTDGGSSEDISRQLQPVSADNITSIQWLWEGYRHSDSYTTVPSPENYTLSFFSEGVCYVKAECNSGNGSYTLEENNLTIDSTAIPLVACGPDSMDPEYLELLANVNSAAIENGKLILYSSEDDVMFFTNGGQSEQ